MNQTAERAAGAARRLLTSARFVPCCLLAALAVRCAWALAMDAHPIDDFSWYYARAIDLAAGRGLTVRGVPTAYWPVGYPLLLAGLFLATGPSLLAAKLLNVALGTGIVWLSYRIARRLFASETAARLGMLLLAFHPNQIAYTSLTATETPFLFLMLLGCLLLLKRRRRRGHGLRNDALAGIVFGLGCLTKPTMLFVPAVCLAAALVARLPQWPGRRLWWRALGRGAMVYSLVGLVILPWTVRNDRVFGRPVFIVTSGGINLLIGNNPRATGAYGDADPAIEARLEAVKDEGEREILARSIARDWIRQHPWRSIGLIPFRLWHLYAKDVEGFYWNELATGAEEGPVAGRPMFALKIVAELYYLALLALFALALWRVRPLPPLGLCLIAYFTLVMMPLFGSSRLHFPMIPCFAWYAGAWLASRVSVTEPQPQLAAPLARAWL